MVGENNPKLKGSRNLQKVEMTTYVVGGGTYSDIPITSRFMNLTGSGNINSFIYDGTISEFVLYFNSASNINVVNEQGPTAINRIVLPDATTLNAAQFTMITLMRDTVANRWKLGPMSLRVASAAYYGYLSPGDWTTFNDKIGGSGINRGIAYFTGTKIINGNGLSFSFDDASNEMGIQVAYGDAEAVVHAKSDISQTIAAPVSISATLNQFVFATEPTSATAVPATPNMGRSTSESATINYGSGSYTANGSTIEYKIIEGYDDGGGTVTLSPYEGNIFGDGGDDSSSNPYSVALNWTANNGTFPANFFVIYRNINGAGYSDYVTINTNSYNDDNTGWSSGTYSPSGGTYPDFFNSGNFSYSAYGWKLSPINTPIYSSGHFDYNFTDPLTDQPYQIGHTLSGESDNIKILKSGSGGYEVVTASAPLGFNEDLTQPFTGSSTVSPTTYGIQSDGTTLNRTYEDFAYNGTFYSSGFATSSPTVDPNDSNYYYIAISPTLGGGSQAKILRDINSAGYSDGQIVSSTATFYDDGTIFNDGNSVTPNAFYDPVFKCESHGSSSVDQPTGVIKSLDGSYTRVDWQDSTGVVLGKQFQNGGTHTIQSQSGARLNVGVNNVQAVTGSDSFTLGSGVFNVNAYLDVAVGGMRLPSISAAGAPTNTWFVDNSNGKASFKDGAGVTHALY